LQVAFGAFAAVAAFGAILGTGCAEEKKKETVEADAGELGPQKPVLDSKLAAAVKAAESSRPSAPQASGDGPPENGVFTNGHGDKAHPPGAPPKVELVDAGSEPRLPLTLALADQQSETIAVTLRLGQATIPLEYGLALKIDKPKDDKKDDKKPANVVRVVGKVTSIGLPAQAPRELADKLGKFKGMEVRYALGAATGATDLAYTLPKDADPGLADAVVKAMLDAVTVAMPPLPSSPVGVKGFWMVTDRSLVFGIDAIRYRVYTVDRIDKDGASLSVQVRDYAAKEEADLGAVAPGQKMSVMRFESTGTAKIEWSPSALLPRQAEELQRTALVGTVAGGPQQQQATLQVEVSARFNAEPKK
jgi:hypothetical protein